MLSFGVVLGGITEIFHLGVLGRAGDKFVTRWLNIGEILSR